MQESDGDSDLNKTEEGLDEEENVGNTIRLYNTQNGYGADAENGENEPPGNEADAANGGNVRGPIGSGEMENLEDRPREEEQVASGEENNSNNEENGNRNGPNIIEENTKMIEEEASQEMLIDHRLRR